MLINSKEKYISNMFTAALVINCTHNFFFGTFQCVPVNF